MNKRRLLKLADLLEADAKNKKGIKFDLRTWAISNDKAMPLSCNTTACAMGLAALSGAFKSAGLRYKVNTYDSLPGLRPDINIICHGRHGIEAAAALFDIEFQAAVWLFSDEYYPGRTTGKTGELKVAKRIRDFVAGKAAP